MLPIDFALLNQAPVSKNTPPYLGDHSLAVVALFRAAFLSPELRLPQYAMGGDIGCSQVIFAGPLQFAISQWKLSPLPLPFKM
jgi:hypothetical protein